MSWGKKRIAGVTYDLSHLNPFAMSVTPTTADAPTYRVGVMFGCHTFTRKLTPEDSADLHFKNGKETRCFCIDRHKLSLGLPGIIAAASKGGRAFFSNEPANYLVIDSEDYGDAGPYVVLFKLEKARKAHLDVAMFVVSAYLKPALPKRLPATTFSALIGTVAAGYRPKPPDRKTAR